jgi:hypothetical protein
MYIPEEKKRALLNYLTYLLICAPVLVYILIVYNYAANIPYQDDYDGVLKFLSSFKTASFTDKIGLLFSQHCEHRLLFGRMIVALHYITFGDINFRHLILFNISLIVAILLLGIHFIKKFLPNDWQIPVIILSWGLFDLNNFENADTALAGLFNYAVILFFLLCIYLYSQKNNALIILAVILQVITVFSGGNGIVATFFVVLFNFLNKNKPTAIISTIVFLISAPLYYYHYESARVVFFTIDPSAVSKRFFSVIGANFGIQTSLIMGVAIVLLFMAVLPVNKKIKINKDALPLLILAGFMLASMVIMSFFRGKLPIEQAYSSRYFVYTHLIWAVTCAFLFAKLHAFRLRMAVLVFSCSFYFLNFSDGLAGFQSFHGLLRNSEYYYPSREVAKQIADKSALDGIYFIEKHRADKKPFEKAR